MAKSPLLLGQRHPRYSLTFFAFVLCAWWFLSHRSPPPRPVFYTHNDDLKGRLEREERKYRAMLPERQALIKKFGPTPAQVVMYVARPSIINAGVVVDNRHVSGFLRMSNHGPRTPSVCRESSVSEFTLTRSAGDFFPPIFNCPHELDRIGALSDGGKWMCGISRIQDKPDCVIYSFGMSHFLFPLRPSPSSGCAKSTVVRTLPELPPLLPFAWLQCRQIRFACPKHPIAPRGAISMSSLAVAHGPKRTHIMSRKSHGLHPTLTMSLA